MLLGLLVVAVIAAEAADARQVHQLAAERERSDRQLDAERERLDRQLDAERERTQLLDRARSCSHVCTSRAARQKALAHARDAVEASRRTDVEMLTATREAVERFQRRGDAQNTAVARAFAATLGRSRSPG